jgi:6-phosphogluconolactonase (cycloisomerase 2 family)
MLNWIRLSRTTSKPSVTRRAPLALEKLEDRTVPSGAGLDAFGVGAAFTTVYTESNNPATGQNAVLAFRQDPFNGSLTQIDTFSTHGTGEINIPKVIGPDDGDQQVVVSNDNRFLFAVNEGSNSIASFRIWADGSLQWLGTFESGGVEPDSIGVTDGEIFVANRGDATATHPGTIAPNVTGFFIEPDGRLAGVPDSTVSFPIGTFATQALVKANDRLLFVQLASLTGAPEGNTLVPYQIEPNGTLVASPGGGVGASINPSVQLGLAFNPDLNIIYAGLTASGQIGVYTFDETGRTTFVGAAADQGAGPCWITVSGDGRYLYAANTASDAVGVYSLANPLQPVQIQEFSLGGPRTDSTGALQTNAFELALDPSGHTLYVITQNTSSNSTFPQGNQLHTLTVAADGTLSEPVGPIIFSTTDVPADAHPQGLAVVEGTGFGFGRDEFDW